MFSIAVATEYRLGNLTFTNKNGILPKGFWYNPPKPGEEKSYLDLFREKYFDPEPYHFYPSVYNYLTGGGSFDSSLLVAELKNHYHIRNEQVEPWYQILEELGPRQWDELTDDEYVAKTTMLYRYTQERRYKLADLLGIFYYLGRFKTP